MRFECAFPVKKGNAQGLRLLLHRTDEDEAEREHDGEAYPAAVAREAHINVPRSLRHDHEKNGDYRSQVIGIEDHLQEVQADDESQKDGERTRAAAAVNPE